MSGVGLNSVCLIGNLTADPELRQTPNGTSVCSMRLAVNSREKRNGNWQDRADFFDIQAWGNQADSCVQYLKRGSPVAVSGKLRLEQWEKDGQKHSRVLVVARDVQFLPSKDRGSGGGGSAPADDTQFAVPSDSGATVPDDDIPF